MSAHAVKLPACPNCATDLSQGENFCPTCGQPNHDVNVTFGHVLEETLEGLFHFDSKVWLTLRELLFQPGKLTVDFLAGRRARFVPPIRLYIFVSVVFFFLLNLHGADNLNLTIGEEVPRRTATPTPDSGASSRPDSAHQLFGVRGNERGVQASFGRGTRVSLTHAQLSDRPLLVRLAASEQPLTDSVLRAQRAAPTWASRLLLKRIARTNLATKQEAAHALLRHLSIGMFLLMPLFALLLKSFYRRQRPLYIQHLMFSVHLHAFYFLFFSLLLLLSYGLPTGWLIGALVGGAWVYWVLALRRFSGQGWGRTLWKSALLFGGYVGLLIFFTFGIVLALLALL